MVITQQPSTISMSGNMLPFIINSGSLVNFTLKDGADILIAATYEPDSKGTITIDVKDIIESRLKYNISAGDFYEQTEIVKQFTATIDSTNVTFKVIRAGVLDLADTPTNWLTGNFLTWQPQNKAVTYHSPEWLTYYASVACNIKLKAYFPGEAEQNLVTLGSCQAGKAFTFNLQFAHIAGLLGQKYPTHYDVFAENSAGERLGFIQRYLFAEVTSEQEQWILFENSLGGLDTLRASGETDLNTEHDHKVAIVDGELSEYKIDTKRIYTKNTGHLTDYERRWLLDFPPARAKYIYHSGALRRIAVTETDFRYAVSDLPTAYSFKYRFINQSSCLNLTRSEHLIPSSITVPDIDAPGFFLPPRLSEYPRVVLGEDILIPAFSPHSNKPTVTTVGALVGKAVEETINAVPGHAEGGTLVQVIGEDSVLPATDKNVFSGLRTVKEITNRLANSLDSLLDSISSKFLRKDVADTAKELITFEKGLTAEEEAILEEGFKTKDFIPGINTGKGARIDSEGNAELESATIRTFLEVPTLKYNQLELVGNELAIGAGAVIQSVEEIAGGYRCGLKLEDGDVNPFHVDDIVKGIFNYNGGGFTTSFSRVTEIDEEYIHVILGADSEVPGGQNTPPREFMTIAHWGNFTIAERQSILFLSAKDKKFTILNGLDNYKSGYVMGQFGSLKGLENVLDIENLPIGEGDGAAYLRTLLVQDIIRVNFQGKIKKEITERGLWSLITAQSLEPYKSTPTEQHEVWHNNERYRCIADETKNEPTRNSQDWLLVFSVNDDIAAIVPTYEWSDDKINWHTLFEEGDIYMRYKVGNGAWSPIIRAVGKDGSGIVMKKAVATADDLPMIGNANDDARIAQDTGMLWTWDGTEWSEAGVIKGEDGKDGESFITWKVEAVNIIEGAPTAIFRRGANESLHQLTLRAKFTRNDEDVTTLMNTSTKRLYEFERVNMWGQDDKNQLDSAWNYANKGRTQVTLTHEDIVFIANINMVFDPEELELEYQNLK